MKRPFISIPLVLLLIIFFCNVSFAQETSLQKERAVIDWLKRNTVPLEHVEAENGLTDLQPLHEIWKNVKVVGLGEATHATREFFQAKHRLFEFLVKELNFDSFALEASAASCEPINDYVLHGKGDLSTVLTGQGYSPWDTEEFASLIEWMHRYNKEVSDDKKVQFYGLDVAYNQIGREYVLNYLQKYSTERVAQVDSIFSKLSAADEKWPMRIGEFKNEAELLLPQVEEISYYLINNKSTLISASSTGEFERVLNYIEKMKQFVEVINSYPLRTRFMAQNLLKLMKENPNSKFIVSAHNRHINLQDHIGDTNLGHDLRENLGDQYYAVLFETYQGSYQSRREDPKTFTLSNFFDVTLPPSPKGSLSWYMAQTQQEIQFLDLRNLDYNEDIKFWFNSPQVVNDIQWVYQEDIAQRYLNVNLKSFYDGILFIKNTTPARPTFNAKEKASKKLGF